jgi:hypothetical protein
MFTLWRWKYQNWRMQAKFDARRKELQERKASNEEFAALSADEYYHMQDYDEAVGRHIGAQLWQEASSLDIALPPAEEKDMWQYSDDGEHRYLTVKGRALARKLIGEERSRRFEVKTLVLTKVVIPLLGLIIGIIGALTGLFAVMHKSAAPEKKTPVYEVPLQIKAAQK